MSYHPCVSGCGRSLAPQDGHDHCLTCLGIQHAEEAFVDGSCSSCGDMTISELRNRLRCVKHGGVPLPLPRSGVRPGTKRGGTASGGVRGDLRITVRASPSGGSHPSGAPQPAGVPLVRTGASAEWGTPPVSFGASPDDQMSVAASEGEPSLSGDDDSAALPPSGVVALSEPDPEMTAMLSRAAENVGLVWNPPPRPDPSRLDEWFLGGGRAGFQRPPPVPFFPEVHEELTRSWKAPFTARNKPCGSSPLTTLDGGAALGYTGIPSVERSVAMQLCPTVTSTLRGEPCLPSRACKYSSGLTGSAYRACGEAASALHAMALLQVHQAKALRDLHEGGHDLAVLHELRAATDLALRATKVTAQSLGRAMSTLVVQERHLWLCLTDMKEQEKVQFLNAPVSQTGLFGDAVESCAQQFSAAQKQTEAIKHIMRRRKPAAASTPAAAPQPARRRGRPPVAAPAPTPRQQPSTVRRRGAGHRQDAQPVQAPARPGGKRKCKRPWDGRPRDGENCSSGDGDRTTPSPGGGPGGESFVSFCFCSAVGPAASGNQNFNKRAVSSVSGSQEEESGVPCITGSLPSSSLARQGGVAQEHPSCPFVEPGKGSSTQAPATSRHTQAGLLRFLPHEEESGECYTTHPDPAPRHHRPGLHRPRAGSLCSTSLPHHGTSVAPLVPLARSLGAWLALPSPSRWLLRTIRLGYAIQFARRPPKFRGIRFTSVKPADAPVLRAEIAVLLAKDAIELVPPADMRSGLFSPYFIVPKKGGGLRPILDLRVLNRALHKLPFKMLTQKRIFGCVRPLDWFAAIDLKDAYFHVSILPRHRPFLRFAFEGQAYQYKVLPFGLSLSPRVFTKVVEAALVPLREQGVRILNYLDDWLILAQSRRQLSAHRDLVLKHLSLLGLRVNWEKSKLVPTQRISFLGMEFDSVNQTARLTQERAQSVLNCFKTLSGRTAVPLKLFQRLLGHMAAAAVTVPLGLLHMRPLQHWLYGRIPRWAWKRGTYRVQITPACRKTFRPWSDPSFLRAGVPLEQVSRHAVVFTDASSTGWGATYNGHAVSGVWTGPQLHWHINCLELLAVRLALSRLRGRLQRKDVLVRTDNTATVAYINRQGGLRSRRMSQLARHLLLWSQKHLRSLRAIHIPGVFNRAADELSQAALPGEWRLHPQAVQLIWGRFGAAQVDLFASPETTHCQEFYSRSTP